ncbi:lipoprotein [Kitasatospora viridis]|uniref:L,D-peptidoglycan transpeptidase YkuD (ErfK/YbiS/YcfS/YnhG family) n=2 Tax=Kitasatospora viridis TaxID=281105 RepID=A0A561TSL0_9ACTN|nr:L,D-peptidoglycan transpeptidase YkuD (ErfK/YbiS/YcfS/YnhG family) [Kitasatospora viridis]
MPLTPSAPGRLIVLTATGLLLAGCATHGAAPGPLAAVTAAAVPVRPALTAQLSGTPSAALPGLGPKTTAAIPADAQQVVLATGQDKDSSSTTVRLYERTGTTWTPAAPTWQAHNARNGWTNDHHDSDLRSPIGVFTLTDAGGLLADPGSKLPYTRSSDFVASGSGFLGEDLRGSFDYVIAINYNRTPGTSPLDTAKPLGPARGGGIWLHVDHGGPTHGCVSLPADAMVDLLHRLAPARHPVIVMGDAASLAA